MQSKFKTKQEVNSDKCPDKRITKGIKKMKRGGRKHRRTRKKMMMLVANGTLPPMECSDISIKCNLCAQNFKDSDESAQHTNDVHCGECSQCHYCKNMFANR